MNIIELPSGTGFYNLDIMLPFSHLNIDIVAFLYEPKCHSFPSREEGFYHLTYFKDGNTTFQYKKQKHTIQAGTFLMMPPNQPRAETVHEDHQTKYHIIFNIRKKTVKQKILLQYHDEAEALSNSIMTVKDYCIVPAFSKNPEHLFRQILFELEQDRFGYNYMLSFIFSQIFTEYGRAYYADKFQYRKYYMSNSIDLLSYNIASAMELKFKTITLKILAQDFNMSERQIERHIQKFHDTSFIKKLNSFKISFAKELLTTTNLTVAKIALESGYNNSQYFINVFKKYEGVSPNEYRKSKLNADPD